MFLFNFSVQILNSTQVGSFECALSRVAGSTKNGTGQGRTWKVRPSLCGIPRDGSGPSRCIVRMDFAYDVGGPHRGRRRNGKVQSSVSTAFSDGTSYEQDVGLLNNLLIELVRISGLCLPSTRASPEGPE